MRPLSLGYSPCPNDTFIFYALVHGVIGSGDLRFIERLEDVETLNQMARRAELDITKISFHAYAYLRDTYCLLRSGGALGKGCGPLVVSRGLRTMDDLGSGTIAIPGRLTTAFLLLQIFDPSLRDRVKVMPFHAIVNAVKCGDADAGLIIHESRFTYEQAGLHRILDLGEWWERETGLPIPLGGIIARRELGGEVISRVDCMIRQSIQYAFAHREEPLPYIRQYAQELSDNVIDKHIGLYVNDYSLDMGTDGIRAAETLFQRAEEKGVISRSSSPLREKG